MELSTNHHEVTHLNSVVMPDPDQEESDDDEEDQDGEEEDEDPEEDDDK